MNRPQSSGALPSIDGVRAVAVILVVLGHAQHTTGFPWPDGLRLFGDFANLGVRTFFVLSGFLITHLLLVEEQRRGRVSLRKFYLRRALRIFPAFYCFLAVMAVAVWCGWIEVPVWDFLTAGTYTMNFDRVRAWYLGHTWSLSVEEQFYLLWPSVFAFAAMKRRRWIILAVLAAVPLIRVATWAWFPEWELSIGETFPTIADALATGVLLAILRQELHSRPWYTKILNSKYMLLLVPLSLMLNWLNGVIVLGGWLLGQTALNLMIALLVDYWVTHPMRPAAKLLNSGPAQLLGRLSYPIYLWQQPMLARDGTTFLQHFPENLVLIALAAFASYHLVELPFLRLKDRIGGSSGRTLG